MGSIFGLGRFLEVGNGNPLQCPCLENSMDRGAWQATVYGVTESQMQENMHTHTHTQWIMYTEFPLAFDLKMTS